MADQPVTMTEIAELVDVRRPTVSNWRRRHPSFPRPVRADGDQPFFDADKVAEWLDTRPVPGSRSAEGKPKTYGSRFRDRRQLQTLAAQRGPLPGDRLLAAMLALAALHQQMTGERIPNLPTARRLAKEVESDRPDLVGAFDPDLDGILPEDARFVSFVDTLCETSSPAELAEWLINKTDRLGARLRATMTPPPVADMVAELAGDVTGKSVYDPAAGSGSLLLRVLQSGKPKRVVAADHDPAAVRMLRQRFICQGLPIVALQQDSPRSREWFGVDLVVLDPPFVPSDEARKGDKARKHVAGWLRSWVQYAAGQLVPGGRGIVLVPSWMLTRVGDRDPVARVRDSLLKQGLIAAVIQLPRRAHSFRTGTELAVFVVERPPTQRRDCVVLANADRAGMEPGVLAGWVRDALAGESPDVPYDVLGTFPIEELGWRRPLLPSQLLVATSAGHAAAIQAATRRLAKLPDHGAFEPPPVTEVPSRRRFVRLSEVVRVLAGHRLAPDSVGASGRRVIGAPELRAESSVGDRCLAEPDTDPYLENLTQPGDVVVLPADPPRALVDEAGGAIVESPAQVVRITGYRRRADGRRGDPEPARIPITPHVLAALLTAPRNAARATGSLVRRVKLEGLELPVLTGTEVERLDAVLRDLGRRRDRAARELAALDELTEAVAGGVAEGLLSVAGDTSELGDVEGVAGGTS